MHDIINVQLVFISKFYYKHKGNNNTVHYFLELYSKSLDKLYLGK